MNKEENYGVFGEDFDQGFSPENNQHLSAQASHRCLHFMQGVNSGSIKIADGLTPQSQNPILDKWVANNDQLLVGLVQDIQKNVLSVVKFSLPAHDERQIFFKDASEGLRYHLMENPEGYKSTFVIPMFAHDIGRLLEGRLYSPSEHPHDNWTPHSKFSFMMLQKILDQPAYDSMPQELKDHYLYAVLAHSGDNGDSYMARAVQTCDRMQLIGAEGFYRALSYCVCLMDGDIKYPDDPSYRTTLPNMYDHNSALSNLEYCARNMRENIGTEHTVWQRRIAVENVVLLLSACEGDDALKLRMFAPELDISGQYLYGPTKRRIDPSILEEAYAVYADVSKNELTLKYSPYEVAATAIEAIEKPIGAAKLSDDMKASIRRAVDDMSEIERKSLFRTMMIANHFRLEQDNIDFELCRALEDDPQQFIGAIACEVRKYGAPEIGAKVQMGMELSNQRFLAPS